MKDLIDTIDRFQALKNITGTSKSSSYAVTIRFDPWHEGVVVELGGYDVGNWSRHEYLNTTRNKLLEDLCSKVDEAEEICSSFRK